MWLFRLVFFLLFTFINIYAIIILGGDIMKKVVCSFCAMVFVFSLTACGGEPKNSATTSVNQTTNTSVITNSIDSTTTSSETSNITDKEDLTEKYIREIDDAYIEESKKEENSSTLKIIEVTDTYAAKWTDLADEYYNKIINYESSVTETENYSNTEELRAYVSGLKTTFTTDFQTKSEEYLKSLQDQYGTGSIIGPAMATYKYNLQKEWALQILEIYEQLD